MFFLGLGEGYGARTGAIGTALLPHARSRPRTHVGRGFAALSVFPEAWGEARRGMRVCEEDGMVACAWARIDNRRDLARALGEGSQALADDPARLILRAYRKWGDAAPRHLEGDFAFAIHDPRDRSLFAARDPLGVRPLYWMAGDTAGTGACATSIPALRQAADLAPEIDPEWVPRFLAGISMSREATPFRSIAKVPPGHCLRIADKGARLSRYRDLAEEAVEAAEDESLVLERYRDLLDRATGARLAEHESHGVEISGGLDSSTILAFALRSPESTGGRVRGFGWVRHDLEGPAVLGISQRLGLAHNHIMCAELEPIPRERVWAILGHPAEHGSAVHHWPFYQLAEQLGVTGLLSGFGGDEGVTNYAPNFVREMIERRAYRPLWQALGTNPYQRTKRFARAMLRRDRRSTYSRRLVEAAQRRIAALPLRPDILARLEIGERIGNDAQFDWPFATVRAFSAHMLARPFVSTRTESCSLIAANNAVEYAWPLLDPPLLSCFLKAPTPMYFKAGMGRALHRSAVAGIVPDERRLAPSKYLGDLVAPQHPSAARSDRDRAGELPDWSSLDPMLQEVLDRKKMSGLAREWEAAKGHRAFRRHTIRAITEANHWLASRP